MPSSIDLGCELAQGRRTELIAVHVVEVDWQHDLNEDMGASREQASRVLDLAEGAAEKAHVPMRAQLLQARDIGAALVDEAVSLDADAVIVGLPYRKRFGGDFAMGRTIPYVLKNAPCRVYVVREPVVDGESRDAAEAVGVTVRSVIVGSGRVGAGLASTLAKLGHEVTILDVRTDAFRRLDPGFAGQALRGDGTDEATLRRAGAEGADWFFALTNGDNRNVLAAQLAAEEFGIANVVAKVNDPVRAEAYALMGIDTIDRTTWMIDAIARFMGHPGRPARDRRPGRGRRARPQRSGPRPSGIRRRRLVASRQPRQEASRCSSSSLAAARSASI